MSGSIAQIVYPGGQSQSIFVQPVLDWAHSKIFMCNNGSKLWSYAIPSPLATLNVLNGPADNPDTDGYTEGGGFRRGSARGRCCTNSSGSGGTGSHGSQEGSFWLTAGAVQRTK